MARPKQNSRTEEQKSSSRTPHTGPEDIANPVMPVQAERAPTGPDKSEIPGLILYTDKGYITESEIYSLCNRYIDMLPVKDSIYKNPNVFIGLLKYIYNNSLKKYIKYNNCNYDYDVLDTIFNDIYIPLCAIYMIPITIELFCIFTGIEEKTIYNIYIGINNSMYDHFSSNIHTVSIIRKWYEVTENATAAHVIASNSIGGIFYLKSKRHWSEVSNIHITATNDAPALDLEQIDALTAQDTPPQLPG